MPKQLFPQDIIDNSIERFVAKHNIKTHIIYNIVIFALVIIGISIFYISVDINVNSSGIIKSPGERITIGSPYGALIETIHIKENQPVDIGKILLVLNTERIDAELDKHYARLNEIKAYITDLTLLIRIPRNTDKIDVYLSTGLYGQARNYYISQMVDLLNRRNNAEQGYKRYKLLLSKDAVAQADFEPIEAEYRNACMAIDLFYDNQISLWQTDLDKYIIERRDISTQIEQLKIQRSESVVCSPVKGIVQRIEGVNTGSYVQQGQKLFEISPDSTLYVECMVTPKDIGYIKTGQYVRIQVDAFNYNEWGMAEGEIAEVFNDVMIVQTEQGGLPYFKVLCSLNTKYLKLKNGYKGFLKRGMTVSVRFKITNRTLFQLLYDKLDDWMNPNNN